MASSRSSRTGLWLLLAFILFLAFLAGLAWMLNQVLLGAAPSLTGGTVLEVSLSGRIGEVDLGGSPFGVPLTVREIDEALRRGATDSRVEAAFLDVGFLDAGSAKIQEIRAAVRAFRDAGKPVIALLEIGSNGEVYAAAAADTVIQIPAGQLVLGMVVQERFYRELMDSLGVRLDVFHTGPYKTALHAYTHTGFTDEQRRMQESLLDSVWQDWIAEVAADRGMEPEALQALVDRGLVTAEDARGGGLVDELGYRDDVGDRLREATGRQMRRVGVRDYLRASDHRSLGGLLDTRPVVALVHVEGMLVPGETEEGLLGSGLAGGQTVARYLREAREDAAVRAIVVRIDSPGGAASAADVVGRETMLASERKPVVVSMSDVAASGGYWIAAAGTRILANPATYTGSIGVVMGRLDLSGTYEMAGVENEVLKRGANADVLAEGVPLQPQHRRVLQDNLEQAYDTFVGRVAEGRNMETERVEALAQGRVWTGRQAVENGLVDELGGLRQALVRARADAGIGAEEAVTLRIYPPRRTLLEQVGHWIGSAASAQAAAPVPLRRLQSLRRIGKAGAWALMYLPLPGSVQR